MSGYSESYVKTPAGFDEMIGENSVVRPHWEPFLQELNKLSPERLEGIRTQVNRTLRENGMTYNVHGFAKDDGRSWELDPVPLVIAENDWKDIEAGLCQRAELLNHVLNDVYGPKKLLRKGGLPNELILEHEGFLRPMDGVPVPGDRRLMIYAADLARGPGGRMWVINDHAQAPSGGGFALENRTAMAQAMSGLLGQLSVRRLAGFYREYRRGLQSLAPNDMPDPRVVVYTPGAYSPGYFEHAYLATYLGYNLAEGGDLTVREGRLWLKSLEGLQPVDMLIRRVSDNWCDPLEFRGDSSMGIPGLAQCVREGTVTVVNSLGSSMVENAGLMSFLPGLAEEILGEKLLLPSAASWWCGQEEEREHVLKNLDELVIKPINRVRSGNTIYGSRLSMREREEWRARIRKNPARYIGQQEVSFSTSPAFSGQGLEARGTVLRAIVAWNGSGYSVMPGGLTRSAADQQHSNVSMSLSGLAKDTWVLGGAGGEHDSSWLQALESGTPLRVHGVLSSREGESLFWIGRYAERAEILIHLLREALRRLDQRPGYVGESSNPTSMERLLVTLTVVSDTAPGFTGKSAEAAARRAQPLAELKELAMDVNRVGSLAWTLQSMARSAYSVRDLWSHDAWRVFGGIDQRWNDLCQRRDETDIGTLLDELDSAFIWQKALSGLAAESMTRGGAWHLMELGQRIERGSMICTSLLEMLEGVSGVSDGYELLETALLIHESQITYRRRYRTTPSIVPLLELLLFEPINPRSLAFQLMAIQDSIAELPGGVKMLAVSGDMRELIQWLKDPVVVGEGQADRWAPQLGRCVSVLSAFSDQLTLAYFTHSKGARNAFRVRRNLDPSPLQPIPPELDSTLSMPGADQ